MVDEFSDEELYSIYEKYNHIDFLNFFSEKVEEVNNPVLLNPSAHKSWWSHSKLIKILKEKGFTDVFKSKKNGSTCDSFKDQSKNGYIFD